MTAKILDRALAAFPLSISNYRMEKHSTTHLSLLFASSRKAKSRGYVSLSQATKRTP
jgi:hypothetical protein